MKSVNGLSLNQDNKGVSPVIGTILMVAITVILASTVSVFILGSIDSLSSDAPLATFQSESNDGYYTITHAGGEEIDSNNLYVITQGESKKWSEFSGGDDSARPGDSIKYEEDIPDDGVTVRLAYVGESRSKVLSEFSLIPLDSGDNDQLSLSNSCTGERIVVSEDRENSINTDKIVEIKSGVSVNGEIKNAECILLHDDATVQDKISNIDSELLTGSSVNIQGQIKNVDGDVTVGENSNIEGAIEDISGGVTVQQNTLIQDKIKGVTISVDVSDGGEVQGQIKDIDGSVKVGSNAKVEGSIEDVDSTVTVGSESTVDGQIKTAGSVTINENVKVSSQIKNVDSLTTGTGVNIEGTVEDVSIDVTIGENSVVQDKIKSVDGDVVVKKGTNIQGSVKDVDADLTFKDAEPSNKTVVEGDVEQVSGSIKIGANVDIQGEVKR